MSRIFTGRDVFTAALDRTTRVFAEGHRVIAAVSGGKDSTVIVELCLMAARATGRLPVEVMFRDDEILYPGTAEYLERLAERDEIDMHWIVNEQAACNIYNRELPYYWCFDPELDPEQWVRKPPPYFTLDRWNTNLYFLVNSGIYQPPEGKYIASAVGIRTQESNQRALALQGLKGFRSYSGQDLRLFSFYPIYDWKTQDVWKAIRDNKWDYNTAYDVLAKMGMPVHRQRLSQIAMSPVGAESLQIAARAWPKWWDRVTERLPGIRAVASYGTRVLRPVKRYDESWQECFERTALNNSPQWVMDRARWTMEKLLAYHASHSSSPFPEVAPCPACKESWKSLANALYSGDPFHIEIPWLPDIEPSDFRESETRKWPQTHKHSKLQKILAASSTSTSTGVTT